MSFVVVSMKEITLTITNEDFTNIIYITNNKSEMKIKNHKKSKTVIKQKRKLQSIKMHKKDVKYNKKINKMYTGTDGYSH